MASRPCPCSPEFDGRISEDACSALTTLHKEGSLISKEECIHLGPALHDYGVILKVVPIIVNRSTDISCRICEVLEEHGLLEETERSRLKVAVDVYHKEHLLTKEEFEDVFQYKRSLHAVLPSKDVTTVDRIAEILDKHGFVAKARDIRALAILYQGEGLLSEEECIHMGSSLHLHDVFSKVVLIIINKSTSVSYRICEVFEKYEILSDVGMRRLKVVLDVYQIEHLLREEELKEAIEWEWHRILPSKDAATATRIGEILEKHGLKKEARELRALVTLHQAEDIFSEEESIHLKLSLQEYYPLRKVVPMIINKSTDVACRICEVFEECKILSDEDLMILKALVILHQREGLLSEEECILLGSSSTHTKLNLQEVVPIIIEKSTDVSCRICEVLEEHEILSDEEIRTLKVVVDVYHKEHLLMKEDVEKVNKCGMQWSEVLPSKDAATATRISKILDKHGFEKKGQMMRVLVTLHQREGLLSEEECVLLGPYMGHSWTPRLGCEVIPIIVKKSTDVACRICEVFNEHNILSDKDTRSLQALIVLHQREGLLSEEECISLESSCFCDEVVAIIVNKSSDVSYRICKVYEEHKILSEEATKNLKVAVDVFHKEHLLTKEEVEKVFRIGQKWYQVLPSKDAATAARIAEILDKHGSEKEARVMRSFVITYHKEHLLTEDEVSKVYEHRAVCGVLFSKDATTAIRIAEILDKHGYEEELRNVGVAIDVFHKEHLLTKEEAEKVFGIGQKWYQVLPSKDATTAARIAEILDKHGSEKESRVMRIVVDLYHKEHLLTKEEIKSIYGPSRHLCVFLFGKDAATAMRIAEILDKHGFEKEARRAKVIVDLHHKENLLTRKETEETFRFQHQMNWHKVLPSKDATKVARIADIMDKHGLEEDVREIRVIMDTFHKEHLLTKEEVDNVYTFGKRWCQVLPSKDAATALRLAEILHKHGLETVARVMRALTTLHQRESLLSGKECCRLGNILTRFVRNDLHKVIRFSVKKSTDVTCRICEVFEEHKVLSDEHMRTLKDMLYSEVMERIHADIRELLSNVHPDLMTRKLASLPLWREHTLSVACEQEQLVHLSAPEDVSLYVTVFDISFLEAVQDVLEGPKQGSEHLKKSCLVQNEIKFLKLTSCQFLNDEQLKQSPPPGYVPASVHLKNSPKSMQVKDLHSVRMTICSVLQVHPYAVILRGYRNESTVTVIEFFLAEALKQKFHESVVAITSQCLQFLKSSDESIIIVVDEKKSTEGVVGISEVKEISCDMDWSNSESQDKVKEVASKSCGD